MKLPIVLGFVLLAALVVLQELKIERLRKDVTMAVQANMEAMKSLGKTAHDNTVSVNNLGQIQIEEQETIIVITCRISQDPEGCTERMVPLRRNLEMQKASLKEALIAK